MSELVEELEAVELSRQMHQAHEEVTMLATSSRVAARNLPLCSSPRPGRGPPQRRAPNGVAAKAPKRTDKCGHCGYVGHVEAGCRTKIKEQRIITNLLAQLNKGKH